MSHAETEFKDNPAEAPVTSKPSTRGPCSSVSVEVIITPKSLTSDSFSVVVGTPTGMAE
ncbi:uncharacterized protein TNCV_3261361, partial [Trichonephila clavipes]